MAVDDPQQQAWSDDEIAAVRVAIDMGDSAVIDAALREVALSRLHAVPARDIERVQLLEIVQNWILEGRNEEAARLLEGLFAKPQEVDARDEELLTTLCEALGRLGYDDRSSRLYSLYAEHSDVRLASVALQKEAHDRLGEGGVHRARRCFERARQKTPDDPYLAALEIALLQREGEPKRARECAERWITTLRGKGVSDTHFPLDEYVAQLQAMTDHSGQDPSETVVKSTSELHH